MNICNQFRLLSCDTWKRIWLARRGGFKIYETTVTQNILYFLYVFRNRTTYKIMVQESKDEKANGNDLEIALRTSGGYVKLPTQAKIIYANDKYSALKHKNQVHDLIRYASSYKVKGIPLYLFFNYSKNQFLFPQSICGMPLAKEDYGCTICDAIKIRDNFAYPALGVDKDGYQNWIIPSFSDLHPAFCFPFWTLVCCHSAGNTLESLKKILKVEEHGLVVETYTEAQLLNESLWKPFLVDDVDVGKDGSPVDGDPIDQTDQGGFNPKFRIIIG